MSRRRYYRYSPRRPVNPLGPPLLALIAAALFGLLYLLFDVGKRPLEYALAVFVLYGGAFVFTMTVAGLVWGAIAFYRWLAGSRST
jgi:hypothetical protein